MLGNSWIVPPFLQVILSLENLNNLILINLPNILDWSSNDFGVVSQKVARSFFHTPHNNVV